MPLPTNLLGDGYRIKVRFRTHPSIVRRQQAIMLQRDLYDEGGMSGDFEVIDASATVETMVVFQRYIPDDEEYALERCPDDLRQGLLEQFKAELTDCVPEGMDHEIVAVEWEEPNNASS
jgi:hypothetical protein